MALEAREALAASALIQHSEDSSSSSDGFLLVVDIIENLVKNLIADRELEEIITKIRDTWYTNDSDVKYSDQTCKYKFKPQL